MKFFDETFWKMLLGFIVMLVIGLASIFVVGYFGNARSAVKVEHFENQDTSAQVEEVAQ